MRLFAERWYQTEAIQSLLHFPSTHPTQYDATGVPKVRNPLVCMPTGTGKSYVIAKYCETVVKAYPTCRILICTHVKELIEQNFNTLKDVWPGAPAGVYSAGLKRREIATITFAGIASIKNKLDMLGRINIMVIDEAHLLSPNTDTTYQDVINQLRAQNPHLIVIGLTATPYRLGIGSLTNNGIFTDTAYDCTSLEMFNRLVNDGFLAPLISRRRTQLEIDLSNVGVQGSAGDYKQNELQAATDKPELTEGIVRDILEHGFGRGRRCGLIFASGVEHAEHVSECFARYGFDVPAIHQGTKNRDEILRDFKAGRYWALVNNNILTTGFDHPPIDFIALLRATMSTGLYVQMLGRGTRPAMYKANCLVHDYAGNTARLGPINDPCIPKMKGAGKGDPPVWCCPQCETYNHARAPFCVECGCPHDMLSKLDGAASTEVVMIGEEPVTHYFNVNQVIYFRHQKKDKDGNATKPPSIRVNYHCGLNIYQEFVTLEHGGPSDRFGREWWRKRFPGDFVPATVDEALQYTSYLKVPARILVHTNTKYPRVLEVEF